jgi:hypothetical protein
VGGDLADRGAFFTELLTADRVSLAFVVTGCRVQGDRVQGAGFWASGFGFRVLDSRFRVKGRKM